MENKEVMVCTFPGADFLGFNTIEVYKTMLAVWEKKEKKAFERGNNFCDWEQLADSGQFFFTVQVQVGLYPL